MIIIISNNLNDLGITNEEEVINYFHWDQSISLKDTIFNTTLSLKDTVVHSNNIILDTFTKTIKYCLLTIATNTNSLKSINTSSSSSSSGSSVAVGFANMNELVKSCKDSLLSLFELRYLLLRDDINSIYISLDISKSFNINTSNDNIGNKYMMICPKWFKTIAYYQHTIGVCLPLLIQVCFNKCYGISCSSSSGISSKSNTTTSFVVSHDKVS